MKVNNILVLAAHPDDEVLGCGATLAKMSTNNNIRLLTFTNGVASRNTTGDRRAALEKSCKMLGINSYHSANFPDNKMDSVPLLDVCKFIEEHSSFEPDIIFTHHQDCLNVDHSIVYRATITAFRPQRKKQHRIYTYYVPSSTEYNPLNNFNGNVYFDVTTTFNKKIECLRGCYSAEMRECPHSRSYDNVTNLMKVWGNEVGIKYAEKFQLIRQVVLF